MRRKRSKTHEAASQGRADRWQRDHDDDAYGIGGKLPDPTVCLTCGAAYLGGRWLWASPPAGSHPTVCPACRRIADGVPAGILTVEGPFAAAHRAEIEALARHVEQREKREHALKRIAAISEEDGKLVVTTTDAKLARAIADALYSAYRGALDYHFTEPENVFRASWVR
jgi:hypothetical protein